MGAEAYGIRRRVIQPQIRRTETAWLKIMLEGGEK